MSLDGGGRGQATVNAGKAWGVFDGRLHPVCSGGRPCLPDRLFPQNHRQGRLWLRTDFEIVPQGAGQKKAPSQEGA
jgi:hypothetical protein